MTSTQSFSWMMLKNSVQSALPIGRYREAVDLLQTALPLAMEYGANDERLAWTSYMLGVCLFRQKRFAEAKMHLRRAATIYGSLEGMDRWSGRALAWFCHCEHSCAAPISKYESHARRALELIGEPDATARDKETVFHVARLLECLGNHCAGSGEHDEAASYFARLLALHDSGLITDANLLSRLLASVIGGRWNAPQYKKIVKDLHERIPVETTAVPETSTESLSEAIHGIEIEDPFRWLERASSDRAAWIDRQNSYAQSVIDSGPYKGLFLAESRRLYFVQRYTNPYKRGDRIFYGLAKPQDRQEITYAVAKIGHFPRAIIDPGKEEITVTGTFASRDGEWMAYSTSEDGSDWQNWMIRHVGTGKDLPEKLSNLRARYLCWRSNNKEFLYAGYERNEHGASIPIICNHSLRSEQKSDEIIFRGQAGQYIQPFEHGKHLFISTHTSGVYGNDILHCQRNSGETGDFRSLFAGQDGNYKINGWLGWRLLFLTDHNAPKRKLISVDVNTGERFTEIEEGEDVLESVFPVTGGFIAHYIANASSKLVHVTPAGRSEIPLVHAPGTISAVTWLGKDDLCYAIEGIAQPKTIYRLDINAQTSRPVFPELDGVDPERYTVRQVFLQSRDGTRIDMFLAHKKGVNPDRDTATWLTGYGGFRHLNSPRYMYDRLLWMDLGGMVAFATIRGGGEYGEEWHRAGCRELKQNVFDDFIGCAEWLLDSALTSPKRLAISGSSNGGLLMAAALTQRPELFGAVCLGSPLTDMLRYHKFNFAHEWVNEYGSAESAADFRFLSAYSPLHNIRPCEYPSTFIQVGAADDRVDPLHSYKFAAALQKAQMGSAPIIVKTYEKQGHTYSCAPTWYGVDQISFLAHAVKLTDGLD